MKEENTGVQGDQHLGDGTYIYTFGNNLTPKLEADANMVSAHESVLTVESWGSMIDKVTPSTPWRITLGATTVHTSTLGNDLTPKMEPAGT